MPMIRLNAQATGLALHGGAVRPFDQALATMLTDPGPVIIMVHGYKYRPGHRRSCPHRTLFATDTARGAAAWPRHLGFGRGQVSEGLGVAFGWDARGPLPQVFARAAACGRQLAEMILAIRDRAPGRAIYILAHSMGSELALEALLHLPAHSVRRIVLLTGASFQSRALHALAQPAGRTAEIVNVTSRENDLFDFLFECLIRAPRPGDRAIGQGLWAPNATTLQLDHPAHLSALAQLGHPIGPANRKICHWSGYLRPGVLRLWSHAMRAPQRVPLHRIAQVPPAPRWSRLLDWPYLQTAIATARTHRPLNTFDATHDPT